MDQGRADVIVAGALILEAVLELAGVDQIEVSVRGLRYGIVSFDDLASPVTH
jgi:exopolyphosphatase/pppGpp-phosphohydrolase